MTKIGEGVEVSDFNKEYQRAIINCLIREIEEETSMKLEKIDSITMLPAWLKKNGIIDLFFAIPVRNSIKTLEYHELQKIGFNFSWL